MCYAFDLSCDDAWRVLFVFCCVFACVAAVCVCYCTCSCVLCEIGCVMLYGSWGVLRLVVFFVCECCVNVFVCLGCDVLCAVVWFVLCVLCLCVFVCCLRLIV